METWITSRTYNHYYETIPMFLDFVSVLVISLFFGLLMTLLIEAPFVKLQKMLVNYLKKTISK